MKLHASKPAAARAARFDFGPAHRMVPVQKMKSQSLKAGRALIALAAISLALGCETTAESDTVPTRVSTAPTPLPPAVAPAAVVVTPTTNTNAEPPVLATTNAPALSATSTNIALSATEDASNVSTNAPDDDSGPIEVVAPTLPVNIKFTEPVKEIVKLGQSTVDESVLLAFVANAKEKFDLDADEILYLHDVGIPSSVIAEMLKKDGKDPKLAEVIETNPDAATLAGPATNAAPAQVQAPAAAPQVSQAVPPPPAQQQIEVTTNYVPNTVEYQAQAPQQQVIVQQPQTQVVYTTPQPPSVTYFYESLSPYGSWYVVPEYGWVWQPSVAVIDPGWQPYGPRGRWVWSSAGWYWHSEYSWGWAPFHYGRWYLSSHRGWVWVPDLTWGPSWVTWRSSSEYYAWAPLPPAARFHHGVGFTYYGSSVGFGFSFGLGYDRYCYVPARHFYHHRPWHYHLPRHHWRHAYDHCRPINRWEFRGRDHFVNHGPGRDHVERHGGRRVHEVAIKDAPSPATGFAGRSPRERFERRGETAGTIYRPAPPKETTQVADRMTSRRDIANARYVPSNGSAISKDPSAASRMPRTVDRNPANGLLGIAPGTGSTKYEGPTVTSRRGATPGSVAAKPANTGRPEVPSAPLASNPGRTSRGDAVTTQPGARDNKPAPSPTASRRDYTPQRTIPQSQITPTPAPTVPTSPAQTPSRRDYTPKPQTPAPVVTPTPSAPAPTPAPSRRDFNQSPRYQAPATKPITPLPTPSPAPATRDFNQSPRYQAPAPSTPAPTPAPSRRDFNQSPRQTYTAPAPAPTPVPSSPAPVVSRRDFNQSPRYQAPAPSYQAPAPSYQAPKPAPRYEAPAPAYQAPAPSRRDFNQSPRAYSAPAPSPAPAPSRSYSAPPAQSGPSRADMTRSRMEAAGRGQK